MTTSIPPRPPTSGGNAKYAIVGLLLLLVASGAIWWALRKPEGPARVAHRVVPVQDAAVAPLTPQVGTEIVLDEEPDASTEDVAQSTNTGRRVRYVYRYVSSDCHGQIDNDAVNAVARQSIGGMRDCYNRALRSNPALRGNVHARWIISPNGTVADIGTSINSDPQFKACFENALRRLHFPAPRGGCANADFNFPLTAN